MGNMMKNEVCHRLGYIKCYCFVYFNFNYLPFPDYLICMIIFRNEFDLYFIPNLAIYLFVAQDGVISWATEHHHACDALVDSESRGSSRTVRGPRHDDFLPADLGVFVEELVPLAVRVVLMKPE